MSALYHHQGRMVSFYSATNLRPSSKKLDYRGFSYMRGNEPEIKHVRDNGDYTPSELEVRTTHIGVLGHGSNKRWIKPKELEE